MTEVIFLDKFIYWLVVFSAVAYATVIAGLSTLVLLLVF